MAGRLGEVVVTLEHITGTHSAFCVEQGAACAWLLSVRGGGQEEGWLQLLA